MDKINELISVLFLSREITHREHLNTDSYAAHVALGDFYEGVITLADTLAEAYQGKTGKRIGDIPYYGSPIKGEILVVMKKLLKKIEEERANCLPDDSTIQNIIDEVISLYLSTIYKLTFLK